MQAKNVAVATSGVDELLFHNDTVSVCLLVNRRHHTLRVIDFRAGPMLAKRYFVLAAAKRERVEKVFTLVERDEVSTWTRLGFTREGSINAFYKRSDAWILGGVVSQVGPVARDHAEDEDDEEEAMAAAAAASPAVALADRTLARVKRQLASAKAMALPTVKLLPLRDSEARKAIALAERSGTALTGFEPFGRDATRTACVAVTRGGFELCASWESQACFGNSFLEILTGPRDESERAATIASVRALCERLTSDGIVSTFCLSPADDAELAMVYLSTGFRRSGVLAQHLQVGGVRKDAIVWSRKLGANAES